MQARARVRAREGEVVDREGGRKGRKVRGGLLEITLGGAVSKIKALSVEIARGVLRGFEKNLKNNRKNILTGESSPYKLIFSGPVMEWLVKCAGRIAGQQKWRGRREKRLN
jgi:hypothetical protein